MSTLATTVTNKINATVPKGVWSVAMNDETVPDYFHGMLYGPTNSFKTTTGAQFGGPERTLIVSTRTPEQIRIPLRGLGYHDPVMVETADALIWAIQSPEKAADHIGFPEWKDRADRVIMFDDMTEGMSLLVDDNETDDQGRDRKDGRQIYRAVKEDIRAAVNSLKRKKMHIIYTALDYESDTNIYPDMSSGSRKILLADLDYVFWMKLSSKKMRIAPESVAYVVKDQFGKDVVKSRSVFTKCKLPEKHRSKTPPLISAEEPLDLGAFWKKIVEAR